MTKPFKAMKTYPLTAVVLLILLQGLTVAPRLQATSCAHTTNCIGSTLNLCETNFAMFPGVTYTYQWTHWQVPSFTNVLAGETNPCLNRIIESTNDAGVYQVAITGTIGGESISSTLCGANVIVPDPVFAGYFPNSNCFIFGSKMDLCPVDGFGSPRAIVWRFNGVLLPNQTNLCLTIDCYKPSNAGEYTVQVFGECGSSEASVFLPGPVLHCFPIDFEGVSVPVGGSFTLPATDISFLIVPGVSYTYQWAYVVPFTFTNFLVGETNAALTRSNVTFANAGAYILTFTATACGQSIFTNLGIVLVKVIPPILNPRMLPNGTFEFTYEYTGPNALSFSVRASSDPALRNYLWEYDGTATAVGGGLYRFTDSLATNHARRFYRLE